MISDISDLVARCTPVKRHLLSSSLPRSCSRLQPAWRRGLRGSHTHTTPPCCTWVHSFPKSLAHTRCPGHLQFCNITQQQYSLNCLAVYFLKRGKISHLKDYLTLPWTSCPPSPLLSLQHHVHTCVYTQMATYMHIHWHIDTWMNRLKHIRPALGWQLWKDRDGKKKKT